MKILKKLLSSLPLFMLLNPALAQTGAIRAKVPLEFTVGSQIMPAGDYRFSVDGSSLLQVARLDGRGVASVSTNYTGGGPGEDVTPRLVFHRYGKRFFLSQAWIGDVNMGHQLFVSHDESEYAELIHQEHPIVLIARFGNDQAAPLDAKPAE